MRWNHYIKSADANFEGFGKLSIISINVFFLFILLCFSGCGKKEVAPSVSQKPSILLITIDTLRADALGCYGHQRAQTPTIDLLATNGILFENVMCQAPATGPSFASMMTSKYPAECGVLHSTMPLSDSQLTLSEILQSHGYRTGAFVSCSILHSRYGFSQGFDVYNEEFQRHYSKKDVERVAPATTEAAVSWIREQDESPFFCWLHYFDPHVPYEPHSDDAPTSHMGTTEFLTGLEKRQSREELHEVMPLIGRLYDGEVTYVDKHIGKVLSNLSQIQDIENTLIILAADHGEELFDHFFFHGHVLSLFQSVLRTPLIISYPAKLPQNLRISGLVENVDILPTILSCVGITPPEDISGRNLLPVIKNPTALKDRTAYSQREPYAQMPGGLGFAIQSSGWKYIYFSDAPHLLFNLTEDPMERKNEIVRHPEKKEFFLKILSSWKTVKSMNIEIVQQENLKEDQLRTLKSLGYIQ